jgi:hypothetical protein
LKQQLSLLQFQAAVRSRTCICLLYRTKWVGRTRNAQKHATDSGTIDSTTSACCADDAAAYTLELTCRLHVATEGGRVLLAPQLPTQPSSTAEVHYG